MVLNPNPEEKRVMKKPCRDCGRKIVKLRVDWKNRDLVCQTCKTLGVEGSIAQRRMVESKGLTERTELIRNKTERSKE